MDKKKSSFQLRWEKYQQAKAKDPNLHFWDFKAATDEGDNDPRYIEWRESLPENLKNTDEREYDLYGAYQSGAEPHLEEDGYHLPSRNQATGKILKRKNHKTYQQALDEDRKAGYYPVEKNGATFTRALLPTGDLSGYADGTDENGVKSYVIPGETTPVRVDDEGYLTGEDGTKYTVHLPETYVTANKYRTAFDGSLNNAHEFLNAATAGFENRLSPTQNIRLAYDAATFPFKKDKNFKDLLNSAVFGNNGIISDSYAAEHPKVSFWTNLVGDLISGAGSAYRGSEAAINAHKMDTLWDLTSGVPAEVLRKDAIVDAMKPTVAPMVGYGAGLALSEGSGQDSPYLGMAGAVLLPMLTHKVIKNPQSVVSPIIIPRRLNTQFNLLNDAVNRPFATGYTWKNGNQLFTKAQLKKHEEMLRKAHIAGQESTKKMFSEYDPTAKGFKKIDMVVEDAPKGDYGAYTGLSSEQNPFVVYPLRDAPNSTIPMVRTFENAKGLAAHENTHAINLAVPVGKDRFSAPNDDYFGPSWTYPQEYADMFASEGRAAWIKSPEEFLAETNNLLAQFNLAGVPMSKWPKSTKNKIVDLLKSRFQFNSNDTEKILQVHEKIVNSVNAIHAEYKYYLK